MKTSETNETNETKTRKPYTFAGFFEGTDKAQQKAYDYLEAERVLHNAIISGGDTIEDRCLAIHLVLAPLKAYLNALHEEEQQEEAQNLDLEYAAMSAREKTYQAYQKAKRLTLLPEAEYAKVLAKETDENNHSFAVVSVCAYMLAKGYPCEAEYAKAIDILEAHEKQGSISREQFAARCEILHRLDKMTPYFSRFKKCL